MGNIKAITFDLWDTLVIDDSDEAKRSEQGLRSKFDERRYLLWEALNADGPIDLETVCLAYSVGDAAFNKVWKEHHITWHIAERLRVILKGLGRELPDATFDAVVRAHAKMEVEIPPDAMPGVAKPFTGFAFSDEVGHSKPHRSMFDSAARQLGVEISEMLHVGDRDHNDVKGPQQLGMKAILFTASRDVDKANTTADAICESFDELEAAIDQLSG